MHRRRRGASNGKRGGSMHQESKIVELRPVAAGPDPARDKPGIVPSIVPSELTEDLKWVLREIRGVEAIRSESGRLDQIGKRRAAGAWLTAGMIAIGALVCIAAENGHPFASIGHSGDVGAQRSVATNRSGDACAQLAAFDLLRAADAARVQQRLADLGFLWERRTEPGGLDRDKRCASSNLRTVSPPMIIGARAFSRGCLRLMRNAQRRVPACNRQKLRALPSKLSFPQPKASLGTGRPMPRSAGHRAPASTSARAERKVTAAPVRSGLYSAKARPGVSRRPVAEAGPRGMRTSNSPFPVIA